MVRICGIDGSLEWELNREVMYNISTHNQVGKTQSLATRNVESMSLIVFSGEINYNKLTSSNLTFKILTE